MRRIYLTILLAGIILVFAAPLKAQVSLSIGFNLGIQPAWGPTGYDYVENYYLPDIDVYYNVPLHRYYYYSRGGWRYSSYLPSRYNNYDFYNSYKVVVNDKRPWRNHDSYRNKYASYKGQHDQQPIRDSRDSKYYVNKYHPEHNNWVKQQKHENNNRNTVQKGNDGNRNNDRNKAYKQNNNQGKSNKGKNRK